MVLLNTETGQMQVRLFRLSDNNTDLEYLPEYCRINERDGEDQLKEEFSMTRYIVAEKMSYGIKITLKKGFVHGIYNGNFTVFLRKLNAQRDFANYALETYFGSHFGPRVLNEDRSFTMKTQDFGIVNGELRKDCNLTLDAFTPGMIHC